MKFTPIKPKKVSTQIADQIKASILAGEFNPGDKLPPERELAELFGVSRPSVREALNFLASTGLVETYQGGGTLVRSLVESPAAMPLSELIRIDGDRALDVIEVRKGMESWTSWYAAKRALPEDVRRLETIVAGMAKSREEQQHPEDLDAHFHTLIARATHNVVWFHMMQSIFDAMQEFQRDVWRAVYLTEQDRALLYGHHLRIFETIRDRDAEGARDAMMEHLDFAEKRCSSYVSMRGGADLSAV
jgi:GntR family transcriptional regulator, transcriptional repressor for pyruvate dehydrogenase complex